MKRFYALSFAFLIAFPAFACVPPPGLGFQQWYARCGREMEYGYSLGGPNRPSHDAFMSSMYRMYQTSRPTYNPNIAQSQRDLANTMATRHQQNMDAMNQQQTNRNANFNDQQREKAWRQNQEMMYIQNEHCLVWNTAHTYCLKAPN